MNGALNIETAVTRGASNQRACSDCGMVMFLEDGDLRTRCNGCASRAGQRPMKAVDVADLIEINIRRWRRAGERAAGVFDHSDPVHDEVQRCAGAVYALTTFASEFERLCGGFLGATPQGDGEQAPKER